MSHARAQNIPTLLLLVNGNAPWETIALRETHWDSEHRTLLRQTLGAKHLSLALVGSTTAACGSTAASGSTSAGGGCCPAATATAARGGCCPAATATAARGGCCPAATATAARGGCCPAATATAARGGCCSAATATAARGRCCSAATATAACGGCCSTATAARGSGGSSTATTASGSAATSRASAAAARTSRACAIVGELSHGLSLEVKRQTSLHFLEHLVLGASVSRDHLRMGQILKIAEPTNVGCCAEDFCSLSGWWYTYPSEKWWTSSVGMMTFPTEWKVIKIMFQKN